MAENVDLPDLHRGDSKTLTLTITDSAAKAIDISGDEFYLTLKQDITVDDAHADMQVHVVAPADATSAAGKVIIPISPADSNIDPAKYNYDIEWVRTTSAPGEVHTLTYGKWTIIADVTRTGV